MTWITVRALWWQRATAVCAGKGASFVPTDSRKPVVIIGAGIGGLSAAIRPAAAGRRAVMLEQNPAAGGKMSQIVQDGFRWDTGPSVITMRHVFEDLFAAAGRRLDDYLTLLPVDPLTRYFFPDGTHRRRATSRVWPSADRRHRRARCRGLPGLPEVRRASAPDHGAGLHLQPTADAAFFSGRAADRHGARDPG